MITPSFNLTATERVLPRLALDFTTAVLDPRITFARADATATRVNSSGYIEPVAADTPRFDYNSITLACKGLLIENAKTNLLQQSEDLNAVVWVKTNATIDNASITSPSNLTNGNKLTNTQAFVTSSYVRYTTAKSINTTYTLSFFAKAGSANWLYLRDLSVTGSPIASFDLVNGVTGVVNSGISSSSIESFKNGWYRCSITSTTAASIPNNLIDIGFADADNSRNVGAGKYGYLWGAQLEDGAFATSYIPTTTTALTRNADVATMTGTNFSDWYSAGAGGVVARVLPSTVSGTRPALQFDDNTTDNIIALRGNTTNPELVIVDGGSPEAQIDAGTITANTTYNLGAAWSTNDCAAAVNGGAAVTDTTSTIPTVTQSRLGSDGTNYLNGHLQIVRYWPQRIINAEVQAFSK
jgi:hypothetical protein